MQDDAPTGEVPENSYQYYEWMDKHERRLRQDIPLMQKELREDFDISPS